MLKKLRMKIRIFGHKISVLLFYIKKIITSFLPGGIDLIKDCVIFTRGKLIIRYKILNSSTKISSPIRFILRKMNICYLNGL